MGEVVTLHEYYPPRLLFAGTTGRALVAYSISSGGIAEHLDVIRTDNPAFGSAAIQFMRDWHFDVPTDWSKDGEIGRAHV